MKNPKSYGTGGDTKITQAKQPPPTHPQLLTMEECSREEVLKGKKLQYDPPTHPGHQLDQVDTEIKNMG